MDMEIEWCDSDYLLKLSELTEVERQRLQDWAFETELKNNKQIQDRLLHKCRQLAKIREAFKELSECYKD